MKRWKRSVVRWLFYAAAAWIFASWGVNGTVNPLRYVQSFQMQEQRLSVERKTDGIFMMFPRERKMDWLVFWIDGANLYFRECVLCGITDHGEEEQRPQLTKGRNTIRLPASWKGIRIPMEPAADNELSVETAYLTEYEKLSVAKTLYLTAAFLLLFGFWECVQWVKRRYTS